MNSKNKIGILTLYHNNFNYGGLLQAYALWKVLDEQGYDVKEISYHLDSGYPWYRESSISSIKSEAKTLAKKVLWRSYYTGLKQRDIAMHQFELTIPHTEEVTAQEIHKLNASFDTFICGSDQIWNPIGWQDTLFLSFVSPENRKIAYAASMARDFFTKEEADYAYRMTRDFTALSVREEQSLKAMREHHPDFTAEIMPDPTLLLPVTDWNEITKKGRAQDGEYIFAYFLGNETTARDRVIEYAKVRGKKIYFINYLNKYCRNWEKVHQNLMVPYADFGVPDFLAMIQNASLVITDSFHGAVFSSIFHTPFVVMSRFKSCDKNSMNSRIDTLMTTLSINRKVEQLDTTQSYPLTEKEISNIDNALKLQRKKGIGFLNQAMQERYNG